MRIAKPHRILHDPANDRAPLTLSGTQYSAPVVCGAGTKASFHLVFAGTMTTAVTLWSTNIPKNERLNDATSDADWVQETGIVITGPAGSASKNMIHIVDLACEEIRVKLVTSGGAGTVAGWGKAAD